MELKQFLTIYRYFYGTNFNVYMDFKKNRLNHLRAQSLYYLLSFFAMDVNSNSNPYGYNWLKCPQSQVFENDLSSLNVKKDEIKAFYCHEYSDDNVGLFLHPAIVSKLNSFKWMFLNEEIEFFLKKVSRIDVDWMVLLASVAFIKNVIMPFPSAGMTEISRELYQRGIRWSQVEVDKVSLNAKAWRLLQMVGIIPIGGYKLPNWYKVETVYPSDGQEQGTQ